MRAELAATAIDMSKDDDDYFYRPPEPTTAGLMFPARSKFTVRGFTLAMTPVEMYWRQIISASQHERANWRRSFPHRSKRQKPDPKRHAHPVQRVTFCARNTLFFNRMGGKLSFAACAKLNFWLCDRRHSGRNSQIN